MPLHGTCDGNGFQNFKMSTMIIWRRKLKRNRTNDTRYKSTTDASTTRAFKHVFRVVSISLRICRMCITHTKSGDTDCYWWPLTENCGGACHMTNLLQLETQFLIKSHVVWKVVAGNVWARPIYGINVFRQHFYLCQVVMFSPGFVCVRVC